MTDCDCFPHGPNEPCTCDGCWACDGHVLGCCCDIAFDCEHESAPLPIHRTEAGYPRCSTCDGGGCLDCTDPA